MPGSFLNDTDRERLRGFPTEIPSEDLIGYFTLSERDRLLVRGQRRAHNRLGFALQICALRYLGFVPAKLHSAPPAAIGHLAEQLGVAPRCLAEYGERSQTRTSRGPSPKSAKTYGKEPLDPSIWDNYVNKKGGVGGTPRDIAQNYGVQLEVGAMFADEPPYFAQ